MDISSSHISIYFDWPDKSTPYLVNSQYPKVVVYKNFDIWSTIFKTTYSVKGRKKGTREAFTNRVDYNKPIRLLEGFDYSVAFSGNLVTITGLGSYSGSKSISLPIGER